MGEIDKATLDRVVMALENVAVTGDVDQGRETALAELDATANEELREIVEEWREEGNKRVDAAETVDDPQRRDKLRQRGVDWCMRAKELEAVLDE